MALKNLLTNFRNKFQVFFGNFNKLSVNESRTGFLNDGDVNLTTCGEKLCFDRPGDGVNEPTLGVDLPELLPGLMFNFDDNNRCAAGDIT